MTGRNVLSLIRSMDRALRPVIPKVRVSFLLKREFFRFFFNRLGCSFYIMFTFIRIEIIRTEIVLKRLRRLVYKLYIRKTRQTHSVKALVRLPIKNTWFEEPLASSRRTDSEGWCCFFPDHFSDFSMHRPHYLNAWNWLRNI